MRKKLTVLVFCCIAILTSCSLTDKLGFDTYDYMSESVTSVHDTDDEDAERIHGMLAVLAADKEKLPYFENMSDAINEYRDAVLLYMLDDEYAKFSGNTELIEKAEKAYPEYTISQIIPASEFEAMMYRYFGGDVKITHRDGERFKYLSKVEAYISLAVTKSSKPDTEITYLAETDKTYRVKFKVCSSSDDDNEYFALIIKRDDGTLYFKKLLNGKDVS
jgi:hypothetical protein